MRRPSSASAFPSTTANGFAQALDSLLGQTLGDLEIIVSDNASTDRTAEICKDYAARDARIRYIRQESPDLVLSRTDKRIFYFADSSVEPTFPQWRRRIDLFRAVLRAPISGSKKLRTLLLAANRRRRRLPLIVRNP